MRISECVLSTVADEKNEDRDGTATDRRVCKVLGIKTCQCACPPKGGSEEHTHWVRGPLEGWRTVRTLPCRVADGLGRDWLVRRYGLEWQTSNGMGWGPITGVPFRLLVMLMVSVIPNGRLS